MQQTYLLAFEEEEIAALQRICGAAAIHFSDEAHQFECAASNTGPTEPLAPTRAECARISAERYESAEKARRFSQHFAALRETTPHKGPLV
ncbi:hypothetical protein [Pseudogemmobacter faecipullorum]|uniref:Uncharacterized protein n=1 Tax=Pseudogemmobacter faecipullorum TaxID=2755041 RepID=A0ABS8CSH1_9RHOB|nr:hypothetical protein [Pseudogemmobacter faecipullorum]MCB5412095.1 hypothetical protein [Pseudogemmobacter faecipullorum]